MNQDILLQTLLNSCFSGVMALKAQRNESGKIIDFVWSLINNQAYKILKRDPKDQLLDEKLLDHFPEFEHEELFGRFVSVTETGVEMECEFEWQKVGHEKVWFHLEVVRMNEGVLVTFQDNTKVKNTELRLKESEERYKKIESIAHVGSWEYNFNTQNLYWSDEFNRICGYNPRSFSPTTETMKSIIHPADKEESILASRVAIERKEPFSREHRIVRPNGEIRWVVTEGETISNNDGSLSKVIGYYLDITNRKIKETKIQKNEELLRALFEGADIGIAMLDMEGRLRKANPKLSKMLGYTQEELLNKSVPELTYPADLENDFTHLKRLLNGEINSYELEKRYVRKDGSVFWGNLTVSVFSGENEELSSLVISMIQDISERKMAEKVLAESEEQFKRFVTQAPTAIAMVDKKLNYIAASRRWSEDFKIKEKDIIGKNHYEVFPEIKEEWKKIYDECLQGTERKRSKDYIKRVDGSVQWLKWEIRPWYDSSNKIGGIIMFTEDITEDVKSEERILKLNEDLTELNQQKVKLLSVIAHDMKAPIASLAGFMNVIFINKDGLTKEELLEYLKHLETSVNNVNDLIEELLLWARNQFNTLDFMPEIVPLEKSVSKLMRTLKPAAKKKGIQVHCFIDEGLQLWADQNMLKAIIRNLISNAIKFTKPGGEVKLTGEAKDGFAKISVADNGVGIQEENLEKIFDDSTSYTTFGTAGEKGTGIGMELVRNFVNKHGGDLIVKSKEGEGSTFTFTIPVKH